MLGKTLKLVGEGTISEVEVPEGATLEQVLASAGLQYDPNTVYRTIGALLDRHDPVPTSGVLVFARAEDNGK